MTVVRYDNNGVFKIKKEIFKPADSRQIKVVCRLVKQQNIRIAEKCLCKKHLNFHIRRKLRHFEIVIFVAYAELIEHKFGVALGIPAIQIGKLRLKLACLDAVFLGEILLGIKRVLFLHNFDKSRISHKNGADNLVLVISEVVLFQNGKALARGHMDFALCRLQITAENL